MVADADPRNFARNGSPGGARFSFRPLRWFRRRLLRRPVSTLAMSVGLLLGCVIVMNALALQTDRHPSPMFTSMIEERKVAAPADAVPVPPVRPDAQEKRREPAAKEPRAAAAPREETARAQATAKEQMLAIIKGGTPEQGAEQAFRVLQVQKALNKAGYGPLKEDGALGPGTRQALEKFEFDRKLPVKGEPQGRTLRELARISGLSID